MLKELFKKSGSVGKKLGFIYFIDASKTYQSSISFRSLRAIIFSLSFLLVWSFASGWWILQLTKKLEATENRLGQSLAGLFTLEDRLDNPQVESEVESAVDEAPKALVEEQETKIEEVKPLEEVVVAQEKISVVKDPEPEIDPLKVDIPETVAPSVLIEAPQLVVAGNNIRVLFSIKNQSNSKQEGYVGAVAKYQDLNSNKFIYEARPQSVLANINDPKSINSQRGSKFSIQRFRQKNFDFEQVKADARLVEIQIFLDIKGKIISELKVPVAAHLTHNKGKVAGSDAAKSDSAVVSSGKVKAPL
ncbi:MAG: hypothetical protein KBD78_01850 [Oligoflexales bacterium]|nr:hypothetical protein [Oligoflexales bacterium]